MNVLPHPDADKLTAYLVGKLSLAEMENLENHLGNCQDCRSRVEVLDQVRFVPGVPARRDRGASE